MKLTITPKAHEWFKEEVQVQPGSGVRFYGKVYGKTAVHEGFSMGMSVDTPDDAFIETKIDDITYFIEQTDDWFFKGYDLTVDYDPQKDEPIYEFTKNEEDLKQ